MRTVTQRLTKVLALVLTIAALAAGQGAWAETKTVTYTITSVTHNSTTNTYNIVFTRSGVAFNTSAPTNFSTSVSSSSIGQSPGNSGSFLVSLADGFKINVSWESGSNVGFDDNNYISPGANGKQITYNVSCTDETYYVTHVEMQDSKGAWIDQGYDNQWCFSQNYASAYAFGKITITYANTPPFSVFQPAGTDTYNIRNKEELRHLANYVNGGNNCIGLTFLQTQNITYDDGTENNYSPIGYRKNDYDQPYFRGTYNGQGNTVSGINVRRTGSTDADGYIGLFGNVGSGGIVQNVILDNCSFAGYTNVGGIAGRLVSGTVQNCQVTNSVNITTEAHDATNFGGIVGEVINANVIGCISAANVTYNTQVRSNWFGGIAGYLRSGTIKDCLYTGVSVNCNENRGAILGGMDSGTLSNNYYTTTGKIRGVNGEDTDAARFARTVTLGENVTLVGEETPYRVSGLTAIGTGNYALRSGSTLYSGTGQTLTFSGTPATGYEFSGIQVTGLSGGVNGGTVSGNTLTMPSKDVTVNATFSPIVYTITYHTDGGSMSTSYNTYNIESPNLKLATPTKAGLTFFGWYDNESLTGEPVTTIPTGSTGNKEFWAKFRKDIADCTVTVPDQALGSHSYINYKFWDAPATIGETVKDGETTLVLGTDYEFGSITYADMSGHNELDMPEDVGDVCVVTINGIGDYAGSITATFTIVNPSASGTWGDLTWSLADGTLTISGTGAMNVAASNEDYPWFDYKSYIETITIGDGVTSIADGAFKTLENKYHYTVSTVNLPTTLTSIGEDAFSYCNDAIITIPAGVTIGEGAFRNVKKVIGSLSDTQSNDSPLYQMYIAQSANVTLAGRTLYKDNKWNTLCLPFNLVLDGSPLEGATLKELDVEGYYDELNSRYTKSNNKYFDEGGIEYTGDVSALRQTGFADGKLYLYFINRTSISAGIPYIIKWASGDNLTETDPVFTDVQIPSTALTTVSSADTKINFCGNYNPVPFTAGDKSVLFMGGNSTLYYPANDITMGAFRAYFQLNGITAGNGPSSIKEFILNFGEEDDATGLSEYSEYSEYSENSDTWYDLSGRKLDNSKYKIQNSKLPSGIYIHNGRKEIVK